MRVLHTQFINNLAELLSDLASYEPENASRYLKEAKRYADARQ